jgi:hypothetical protein
MGFKGSIEIRNRKDKLFVYGWLHDFGKESIARVRKTVLERAFNAQNAKIVPNSVEYRGFISL